MYTGIMKTSGRVVGTDPLGSGMRFRIEAPEVCRELTAGDSVLVNGLSQSVVERGETDFTIETSAEFLSKTTLSDLHPGSPVNLELALRSTDRLAGHVVQGHVDCVGSVVVIERRPSSWLLSVEFPSSFARLVVSTGSVAVDGISIAVAGTQGNRFALSIDPEAMAQTTLSRLVLGSRVNIEFDVIGKYVDRILKEGIGDEPDLELRDKLKAWGYTS